MKLSEIQNLIACELLTTPNEEDPEITEVMGADMMSDVLAFAKPDAVLVTGLVNSQSVRTADIADCKAIIYVRGKRPDENTVKLAEELSIPLYATDMVLFDVCGILHRAGLKGVC